MANVPLDSDRMPKFDSNDINLVFSQMILDNYNSMEDGISQSVPSYRQGSAQCRSRKENVSSLHPSREKGQKSSYQRLSHLSSDMRKNKTRYSLSSSTGSSEEDASSSESFNNCEMEYFHISSNQRQSDIFSRICQPSSSYELKPRRTKTVSFMIGDDMQEDEIGEDAFQHDFSMHIQDDDSDIEASNVDCYDTENSLDDMKILLADQLENQILELFKATFNEGYSIWGLQNTLNFVTADLMRLSEDEPYGVKGANVIVKFSKLQNKQNDSKEKQSKFSRIRRSSNLSSSSTSSDNENLTGFEKAETLGVFEMCQDTVSTFELILTIREEKRHLGLSLRNWLGQLTGSKQIHVISPEFSLTKRKLYRMSS